MELGDRDGDDASVYALERDAGAIAGEELGLEALGASGVTPVAHRSRSGEGGEEPEEEEGSHGV